MSAIKKPYSVKTAITGGTKAHCIEKILRQSDCQGLIEALPDDAFFLLRGNGKLTFRKTLMRRSGYRFVQTYILVGFAGGGLRQFLCPYPS